MELKFILGMLIVGVGFALMIPVDEPLEENKLLKVMCHHLLKTCTENQ